MRGFTTFKVTFTTGEFVAPEALKVTVPGNVLAGSPAGLTETETVPGVAPEVGLTDKKEPQQATAENVNGPPVAVTDTGCAAGTVPPLI